MHKVLCLVLTAGLLCGCAAIPTNSDVHLGQTVTTDLTSQFIRVIARPPVAGMSPDVLLQGFLDACADSSDDFRIARQYLSSGVSTNWNPSTGIQVYDSTKMQITAVGRDFQISAPLDSAISSSGHRTVPPALSDVSAHFQVSKNENGEWRISQLPNGLLLTRGDVERGFRPVPVYFLNPTSELLVADTVLLPTSSPGAATILVKNLLSGAPSDLAGGVRNAFPLGTKLTYGSVPVSAGVAQVDLSVDVLAASKLSRQEMSAQLIWTLTSLPNVSSVQITVSGQQLTVPGVPALQTVANWEEFNPRPTDSGSRLHAVIGSQVVALSNGKPQVVAQIQSNVATSLSNAASSQSGKVFAGVLVDGKSLVANFQTPNSLTVVMTGEALSEPTFDSNDNILIADFGRGLRVISADGMQHSIPLDTNLIGSANDVRGLVVAPDGVRVALVFANGATDTLAVGSLIRTQDSLRIVDVHRVEYQLTRIRDVVWKDPLTLAVLGAQGAGGQQLYTVGIADGKIISTNAPIGAQSLAVDQKGTTVLGVVDATRASIMKIVFGQWTVVDQGASPFYAR